VGNLILSVALLMPLSLSLLGWLIFTLLRTYCRPALASLIAISVTTCPLIFNLGQGFVPEIIFLISFSLCFLKLFKFSIAPKPYYHILLIVFPFLIRPIEAFLFLGLPLIIYLLSDLKPNKKYLIHIILFFVSILIVLSSYLVYGVLDKVHWDASFITLNLIGSVFLMGIVLSQLRNSNSLFNVSLATLLVNFWYFGSAHKLYIWVYECTFGELAIRTGRFLNKNTFEVFHKLGPLPLVFILLLTISLLKNRRNITKFDMAVLASIVLPLAIGLFSSNYDHRYYATVLISLPFLSMKLFSQTHFNRLIELLLTSVLSIILILQIYGLSSLFSPAVRMHHDYRVYVGEYFPYKSQDGASLIVQMLNDKMMARSAPAKVGLMILSSRDPSNSMNFYSLVLAQRMKRHKHIEFLPVHDDESDIEGSITKHLRSFDYLLIGPLPGSGDNPWWSSNSGKYIVDKYEAKELNQIKDIVRAEMISPSVMGSSYYSYLFVETSLNKANKEKVYE